MGSLRPPTSNPRHPTSKIQQPTADLQRPALAVSLGLLAVLLYVSPYLIRGQDIATRIHDNMDQRPIQSWRIYHESNPFWHAGRANARLLDGQVPAHAGPNLKWDALPFYVLPPFTAYVALQLLTRTLAFVGMWLLLRAIFPRAVGQPAGWLVVVGVAVLYAILPHYPPAAFTVPSLPLLAWCFVAIARANGRWWHWAVLCVLPLFTSFFMGPAFLVVLAALAWVADAVVRKRANPRWLVALLLVTVVSCSSEYRLALDALASGQAPSHRIAQQRDALAWDDACRRALFNFWHGQYHVATHHEWILVLCAVTGVLVVLDSGWTRRRRDGAPGRGPSVEDPAARRARHAYFATAAGCVGLAAVIALGYGLYRWEPLASLRQSLAALNMVNWERLHWLHPPVWYIVLAATLLVWSRWLRARYAVPIVALVLLLQAHVLVGHADYVQAARRARPTWKAFYAEEQFREIRQYINKPTDSYRVVSLGLYPSVALYNGFSCLDGYVSNYLLSYKRRFRRVIAPELEKDENLKAYFDKWGNRSYLFSAELGRDYLWTTDRDGAISGIDIDWRQFKQLGGEYILSAVRIERAGDSGLKLLRVFKHPESAWTIRLYAPRR